MKGGERQHATSVVTAIVLMWIGWAFLASSTVLSAIYLPTDPARTNSFAYPLGIYPIGIFLFPILVGGGFRYWTARVRHFLLKLIPYFAGLFVVLQTVFFGIYLFPEFLIAFQLLSAVLHVVYLPLFMKLPRTDGPPPLPGASS